MYEVVLLLGLACGESPVPEHVIIDRLDVFLFLLSSPCISKFPLFDSNPLNSVNFEVTQATHYIYMHF